MNTQPARIQNLDKKNSQVQDTVEIAVILDKSGSMYVLREATIANYNQFLREQKQEPGKANLSLVLFDSRVHAKPTVDLKAAEELTAATYAPEGNTALNDAIGSVLNDLERRNPKYAIITIITDGCENASKEFTTEQIKKRLSVAQDNKGWRVVYLGANQDAFTEAQKYAISGQFAQTFQPSGAGLKFASNYASMCNTSYRAKAASSILNEDQDDSK